MQPGKETVIDKTIKVIDEIYDSNSTRRNGQNNCQCSDNKSCRRKRREGNTAPTSRELAADDPILAFEVAVEAHDEDEDGNADEGRA